MDRPVARRSRAPRRVAFLLGFGVLGLAAWPWLAPRLEQWAQFDEAVAASRLRYGRVERGGLVRDVTVQGRVVAAYHPTLFSPVLGIVSLEVRAGEEVTAGQVLARVESPELANRLQQEHSTLASMMSDLERLKIQARETNLENQQDVDLLTVKLEAAVRTLARAEEMLAQGLANEIEHEEAQDELAIKRLELDHAREKAGLRRESLEFEVRDRASQLERQEHVLADVERQLGELTIRAPFDGLVANLAVDDREAVQTNQALLNVVDLSSFEIEVSIPENYADDVLPGTRAEIRVDGGTYEGALARLSPEVSGAIVLGTVDFTDAEPNGLRQNQRVSARLVLEERHDVLKVARGPFLESGGGRLAWRVVDGTCLRTRIEVGAISVTAVEILSGLAEGDTIVLSDMTLYRDSETVLIID